MFNRLQDFSIETLATEFESCGLKIVGKYGDLAGAPYGNGEVLAVVGKRLQDED